MSREVVPFGRGEPAILRNPPQNVQAERALLGVILMSNRAFDAVSAYLLPEHFTEAANADIYATCKTLIESNRQASPITLKSALANNDAVNAAGGWQYIASLANSTITIINAADYGRTIYDLHLRRELIALGQDIVNGAFDAGVDESASDQIEAAAGRLAQLTGDGGEHRAVTLSEAVQSEMARWDRHDRGEIAGLSTGMVDLDREMGLLQDGDLIVLGGAPGSGKTSLSMTIAYNVAQSLKRQALESGTKPKRVIAFSAEMSAGELASRAMTTYTGIQGPRRRRDGLQENDWARLQEFAQDVASLPLVLDDRGAPTLGYMRSRARQEQRKGGVALIVADFMQIMGMDAGRKQDNRTEEVGYIARGLKTLARTINCPVIALSSINRAVEARENKRPNMADFRSSGDIEFAADVAAFCFREEYYLERDEPEADGKDHGLWEMKMTKAKGVAEVIIAKAKHGSTGTARLYFDRNRTLFSDLARDSGQEGPPLSSYESGRLF